MKANKIQKTVYRFGIGSMLLYIVTVISLAIFGVIESNHPLIIFGIVFSWVVASFILFFNNLTDFFKKIGIKYDVNTLVWIIIIIDNLWLWWIILTKGVPII